MAVAPPWPDWLPPRSFSAPRCRRRHPRTSPQGTCTTPSRPQEASPNRRAGAAAAEPRHAHVPGVDAEPAGAAVHQPGPEPRLRLQPRRGAPRVPRGGAARSEPGDGLLGPGARARAEHQRGDGAERGAAAPTSSCSRHVKLKPRATPRERAYIDALAERYSGKADDRRRAMQAYAAAMRKVHERFPDDLDAAMLYVESVMDLRPWGYWQRDGAPHEGTAEIVALTEQVLAQNPRHPGAAAHVHPPDGRPPRRRRRPSRPPTRC